MKGILKFLVPETNAKMVPGAKSMSYVACNHDLFLNSVQSAICYFYKQSGVINVL